MPEVQSHGFDFENWIKKTFFAEFSVSYGSKWDVPAQLNNREIVPEAFRYLPVSIKTCKNGCPIGFGDALRQYKNNEDFLLIVGFWEQAGAYKNFVAVEAVKVAAEDWRKLFEALTENDLQLLDATIKNREMHYSEVRETAQRIKKSFPPTRVVLNPKIDSKIQRRLQCGLPFGVFWNNFAGKEPYRDLQCTLFGEYVPNPFASGARVFKR
ncbi:MAG: hypothetical protein M3384_10395 [Acidobacteriota bacterium]|nr:hypothetical protein [Acidobacteriota bacterium]